MLCCVVYCVVLCCIVLCLLACLLACLLVCLFVRSFVRSFVRLSPEMGLFFLTPHFPEVERPQSVTELTNASGRLK